MNSGRDARVARVVALFESLTRADVARLGEFYAAAAHFKDPFNDVHGIAAIERVFMHLFDALDEPRFVVREVIAEHDRAFLGWDFRFTLKRGATVQSIHGGSLLRFAAGDGCIAEHIDYWDASELLAVLPLVGAPLRWLKRRAGGG